MKNRFIGLITVLLIFVINSNLRADDKRPPQELKKEDGQLIEQVPAQLKARAGLEEKQQELALKQAQVKAREEESARKKEERLKELAMAKEVKQAQVKAREEESARKKEERLKEIARAKEQKNTEARARQEEKLRRDAEGRANEVQLKAREEKLAQEKQFKLEQERRAREEELARQREEKLEEEAQQREKRLDELAWEKEQKEEGRRIRQEEFAQKQQERLDELAWEKEQREAELSVRQEELARLKIENQIEEADLKARKEEQRQEELSARQEELDRQKDEARAKIIEAKKNSAQEQIIREAMLKQQKEDEANQGVEKAKIKMEQREEAALSNKNEPSEGKIRLSRHTQPKKSVSPAQPLPVRRTMKTTKITMDFEKVNLKSVLTFITQESGINFVASQKVLDSAPVVSARFKDTAIDEAIKCITRNLGLIYRIDKETVWIAFPQEVTNEAMETRIYYLNKAGALCAQSGPMSLGATGAGLGGGSTQIDKIFTIEDTLKELIPWPLDSKIYYDKRLNALFVRNTPQNLQTLEDILYDIDIESL